MSTLPPDGPDYGQPTPPPPPGGGYGSVPPTPPSPPGPPAGTPVGGVPAASANRAPWGQRFVAFLIDMLLPSLAVGVVSAILGVVSSVLGEIVQVLGYLAVFVWEIYNYGYKQGTTGYSLGKGIVGIKLVEAKTGKPVGFGVAVARYFVHILDAIPCYIGYLWPLWDAKRETFADKILSQAVVVGQKQDPKAFIPEQFTH